MCQLEGSYETKCVITPLYTALSWDTTLGDKCLKMLTQCYAEINALQKDRVPIKAREERAGSQAVVFRGACHHPLIVGSKSYAISENLRKPSV